MKVTPDNHNELAQKYSQVVGPSCAVTDGAARALDNPYVVIGELVEEGEMTPRESERFLNAPAEIVRGRATVDDVRLVLRRIKDEATPGFPEVAEAAEEALETL